MIRPRKNGLEIREITITPIAITDPPLLNAAGLHAPYALRTILELRTSDDLSGVSEIPGSETVNALLHAAAHLLEYQDPFDLNRIRRRLTDHFGREDPSDRGLTPWDQRNLVHLLSAVEVACLDLIGKAVGRPVVDLLGGRMRERVPYSAYLFYKEEGAGGRLGFETDPEAVGWDAARQHSARSPEEIVRQAEEMCKAFGFQSIKLKGGVFSPDKEAEALFALRDAFGDTMPLRFDPNAVWKVETAIRFGQQVQHILEYLEDPVRGQENMARVRSALDLPLATNMCTTSFEDLPSAFSLNSEDIILSDHHYWGGLRASLELERICSVFGRRLSMHSNSHLGISLMAMTHLGAALQELPYALDTHYPWQSEEVIKGGRIRFDEGFVEVPHEPGLGVELDREALTRLHENYLSCGLKSRNDEIEMRKIDPDWRFQSTRW